MKSRKTKYERAKIEMLILTADVVRTSGEEYVEDNGKDNFFNTISRETFN